VGSKGLNNIIFNICGHLPVQPFGCLFIAFRLKKFRRVGRSSSSIWSVFRFLRFANCQLTPSAWARGHQRAAGVVVRSKISRRMRADIRETISAANSLFLVLRIVELPAGPTAYAVHDFAKHGDPEQSHPLLLVLAENLVERLPCIGELLEVG
jgi:hypothetical protein